MPCYKRTSPPEFHFSISAGPLFAHTTRPLRMKKWLLQCCCAVSIDHRTRFVLPPLVNQIPCLDTRLERFLPSNSVTRRLVNMYRARNTLAPPAGYVIPPASLVIAGFIGKYALRYASSVGPLAVRVRTNLWSVADARVPDRYWTRQRAALGA